MLSLFFFWLSTVLLILTEGFPGVFSLFSPKHTKRKELLPISVIIPTRNEEKIIEKTIRSWLNIAYPAKKEIIFCDHSQDSTPKIIQKWQSKYPFIKYLRTDTGSKLGNVLLGAKASRYPWLVINDADKFPEKNSLKNIAPHLTKNVGAVFGKTIPRKTNGFFETITSFELMQKYIDQKFYSNIDSTPYLSLSNCLVRKETLLNISPQLLIADDVYLAVKIREKNLRCLFLPQARDSEKIYGNLKELFKKRFRVSRGSSQIAVSGYLKAMFNRKLGLFGWVVVPLRQTYFLGVNLVLFLFGLSLLLEKLLFVISWVFLLKILGALYLVLFLIYLIRTLAMRRAIGYKNKKFLLISFVYPLYYLIFFRAISTLSLLCYLFTEGLRKSKGKKMYW